MRLISTFTCQSHSIGHSLRLSAEQFTHFAASCERFKESKKTAPQVPLAVKKITVSHYSQDLSNQHSQQQEQEQEVTSLN